MKHTEEGSQSVKRQSKQSQAAVSLPPSIGDTNRRENVANESFACLGGWGWGGVLV